MIHLDTGFLIRALAPESPEGRRLRAWAETGEVVRMSTVAWAEFLCGPLDGAELELAAEIVGRSRDFTPDHAATAARLFNASGRRRGRFVDCMIAAVALADGAVVATTNGTDFRRFEGTGLQLA